MTTAGTLAGIIFAAGLIDLIVEQVLAQRLSEETGVRVIAASDGMRFDMADLG